jgi:hypothetical protein
MCYYEFQLCGVVLIVFSSYLLCSAPFAQAINNDPNTVPLQARVDDFVFNNNMVTFTIKLIWPSNKTCVSEWYDSNAVQGTYSVGWYIGESGAYNVSGIQMEFAKVTVNALGFNWATWPYSYGSSCNYPSQAGDDDVSPGGILTLQTQNNPGMFLSVHAANWYKSATSKCTYSWMGGLFKLAPHDHDVSAGTIDINEIQDETLGVFLLDVSTPWLLDCFAGSYIEVGELSDLQHYAHVINTFTTIDTSASLIGLFGSVTSYNGGDGVTLNAYSLAGAVSDVTVLLQEDTCMDQEVVHPLERLTYIVSVPTTNTACTSDPESVGGNSFTYVPTPAPTPRPTSFPTPNSGGGGDSSDSSAPTHAPTPFPTTTDGFGEKENSSPNDNSSIYLAVFLPICLIVLIAVVGYFGQGYIAAAACAEAENSEHGLLATGSGGVEI